MNIQTLQTNNKKRMSSREMADLCKKPHDNVLKLIRSLVEKGIVKNTTPHQYTHEQNGQQYTHFLSDQRDSLVIVARLSPEFTAAVIDRWQELEAQASAPVTPAIPQSYAEALQLAADQARQLEMAKPKIAHYDNVVERSGLLNATQVGQKLHISAVSLNKILAELGVYNRNVKRGRVFQKWFIDQGLGEVKQSSQGFDQALFTKRGEAWVIERLIGEGVA